MIKRLWKAFWRPSAKFSLGALLIAGGLGGVVFWGGFNTFMEYTNTMEFCVSCHEMSANAYEEYKTSVHYANASGVRATCADCHVPREWTPKLVRKIHATNELFHHFLGTIDTKEKYEANRLAMARRVWAQMEANDSQECRNCHSWHAMDFEKQQAKSVEQMKKALEQDETCISCHKGVAHKMPDMTGGYLAMFDELKALAATEGASSDTLYSLQTKAFFTERDAADPDAKGDGRVLAATELEVVDRDGDLLKVRIDGWQQDQVVQAIYALRGQRIFSAVVDKRIADRIERHATEVDPDTDLTWHRVSLEGWVHATDLIADKNRLWEYAAEMHSASCGTCHSLHAAHHSLANQWIGTMKAMKRFLVLDNEQYRFLLKYLQLHAKDTAGADQHG